MQALAEREVQPEAELSTSERMAAVDAGRRAYVASNTPRRPRPSTARIAVAIARACRPGQWLKNVIVLVAPAAAGAFTRGGAVTDAWVAAAAFCLLSSAAALVNDTSRGSRRAMEKAGLPRRQLLKVAAAFIGAGLLSAVIVSPALGALMLCYLVAALSQSAWSQRVPFADMLGPAVGLMARAAAGDIAAGEAIQVSFLLLVCACALAVGAIKHRAALSVSRPPAGPGRARARRITAIALTLLIGFVSISFATAMSAPSNTPFGVRAVEWLRGNGAAWLVSDVENIYYSWNAPATGGPALRKLPKVGSNHVRAAAGYRPPQIKPAIRPALPGEGVWHGTGPLVRGSSPVLVTTFRPDPNYPQMVAGVAWIDSALTRVQLYPGRYEPPNVGNVPAEVPLQHRGGLLATFNSGFRLEDDSGGFVVAGRVYSPLRAGQATIIGYRDGKVDVTSWHGGPKPGPSVAFARQNLPLIVEGGRLNPNLSNPSLWGATVGNAVRVWRSGVGVDRHGNLIYAAADIQTAQSLAQILQRAGAVRAMELDINYDWTTFNFYGTWDAGNPRKLLPGMGRPATRYLTPDDRDFFAVYARSRR